MSALYDGDVVAWAYEQAALLRAGKWSELDVTSIAEEIEDVGSSEKRELVSRLAVLLAHLLKWKFQPARRSKSLIASISVQRSAIARALIKSPSLKAAVSDVLETAWLDAVKLAIDETGLYEFPHDPLWTWDKILDQNFLPD